MVLGDSRSRRRRRDREQPLVDPDPIDRSGISPTPGSALDLEQAIGGLPERARAVFVLHDVEGYRHDEIAELLSVSPGTSKSQLHRARSLLREALES